MLKLSMPKCCSVDKFMMLLIIRTSWRKLTFYLNFVWARCLLCCLFSREPAWWTALWTPVTTIEWSFRCHATTTIIITFSTR